MSLGQLRRLRWAVRMTLLFGVTASIAANVLHAHHNPISQTISGWPPLALLLTVELTSRIPIHRPLLAFLRVLATVVIAGIAAWVSYWHMQGVAVRYGEEPGSAYLMPVSVDGLIVVASICLVELAGRIRTAETPPPPPAPAPVGDVAPATPNLTATGGAVAGRPTTPAANAIGPAPTGKANASGLQPRRLDLPTTTWIPPSSHHNGLPAAPAAPAPAAGPGRVHVETARVPEPRTTTRATPLAKTTRPAKKATTARDAKPSIPARTDEELLTLLAEVPRDGDGTVPVRRAAAALGTGPDRARRLLTTAGLRRDPDTGTT